MVSHLVYKDTKLIRYITINILVFPSSKSTNKDSWVEKVFLVLCMYTVISTGLTSVHNKFKKIIIIIKYQRDRFKQIISY